MVHLRSRVIYHRVTTTTRTLVPLLLRLHLRLLQLRHALRQRVGLGVVLEVVTHRLQQLVQVLGQRRLQVSRMQLPSLRTSPAEPWKQHKQRLTTVLGPPSDGDRVQHGEDDQLKVGNARVVHDFLLRAPGALDLGVDLRLGILHEDGGVGDRLGHFAALVRERGHHVVRHDDGPGAHALQLAVLARQHVDLALVEAQLADVRPDVEDVGALHRRVEQGGGGPVVALRAPQRLAAALEARDVEGAADVHDQPPVEVRVLVDLLAGPQELHRVHVHAGRPPHVLEVLADEPDVGHVPAELVVEHGEPVGDPHDAADAHLLELVDLVGLAEALRDVHAAGGLESIVAYRDVVLPLEECLQLLDLDALDGQLLAAFNGFPHRNSRLRQRVREVRVQALPDGVSGCAGAWEEGEARAGFVAVFRAVELESAVQR
ncbi:response regulator [Babesia caballi]|uniref:Response regulator n=1 Tax=Babesia caballi TaxID=5871 RepID=A0AAV4LY27_BABCB|nr:response regulator [Babesia caballi]